MSDRTNELQTLFQSLSSSIPSSSSGGGKQPPFLKKSSKDQPKNAFHEAAGEIAKGVAKTSQRLTKLTSLVKNQGLFDDPTDEINSLIFQIKQDLDDLNGKCDTAQQFIDSKKSILESFASVGGGNGSQSSQHNSKVVSHLKSDLMNTTKSFKSILELRSNKMRDQQQRKVELVGKSLLSPTRIMEGEKGGGGNHPSSAPPPPSSSSSSSTTQHESFLNASTSSSSALTRRNQKKSLPNPYANPYAAASSDEGGSHNTAISHMEENRQQSQHLLLEPLAAEGQYYDAREQAVTEVEKTIGELGQLFKRLATMIQAQQEMVERIDDDVENAVSNTDRAKDQLLKAFESASSNRGMLMKIGAILVVFFLVFILFFL